MNESFSGAYACPSCGATYRRWIWTGDAQKLCALCQLNGMLINHGLRPYQKLPGYLARFFEREGAKHHG